MSLVQHRLRRIKQRHVITGLGQRKRLMTRAAADVEHRCWRRRQMLKQLLVQDIGANPTLDRGIRAIDERIGQRSPRIIGHTDDHLTDDAVETAAQVGQRRDSQRDPLADM